MAFAASDLRQVGMVNVPGAPGFGEMVFCNGMLLMTHPGASAVDVFDPAKRRVIAQVTGLQSPRGIEVDEQNGRVYVADHGSNSIAVISTDGWKVVDSIGLSGSPDALQLDGTGKIFWTDADAGTISLLDLHTKQDVARSDTGGTPRDLAWDNSRKMLFATLQDLRQVMAVDQNAKIVNRFTLNASQPTGLSTIRSITKFMSPCVTPCWPSVPTPARRLIAWPRRRAWIACGWTRIRTRCTRSAKAR